LSARIYCIPPHDLQVGLTIPDDFLQGIIGGDWDLNRCRLSETEKHRSCVQHYVHGIPWERTVLFLGEYAGRIAAGEIIRGATTIEDLAERYRMRLDPVFESLKTHGFRLYDDAKTIVLPNVHIGRDGAAILGSNGNHRVAMAKIIGIEHVLAHVQAVHVDADKSTAQTRWDLIDSG